MGRSCSICTHPDREAIDEALVGGTGYRDIAGRFDVSLSSLSRHRERHVSEALQAVVVERERDRAEGLLDRVEGLIGRTENLLVQAEASGKVSQALAAVREMRSLLELLGKATGELRGDGVQVVVNLATSEEWLQLRHAVLGALGPHPDARTAVVGALAELEAAP